MNQPLTVVIPCKNERKNIRHCVESVRDLAAEIIIADSGSTDGTLEVVERLGGCRLLEREYVSPSSFKNWVIPQARHEWVLIVDADERVSPALAAEIREVLRQDPADIDGYWIPFRCFFMGHELRHSGWNTPACRLIRRDKCRYKADVSVHEEIEIAPDRAGRLNAPFLHYSYWTYDEYFEKYLHYTRLRSWDMWDAGKRSGLLSLLVRPALRFIHMYIVRGGFRDGLAGVQICVLTAFFNTFVKQARLWEREHALPQPDPDHDLVTAQRGIGLVAESSEANCRLAWRAAREQTVLRRVA